MRLLVDTQLLLWAAAEPHRVPKKAGLLMEADDSELHFSVASLWETTIKNGARRADFQVDTRRLRARLIQSGYRELAIEAEHALLVLPPFHRDPLDRILVAQASVEGLTLLTADAALAQYSGYTSLSVV